MSVSSLKSSSLGADVVFVGEVDKDFECAVCLNVSDDPASCGRKEGCAAIYCFTCLKQVKKCPTCSFGLTGQPSKNLLVKNIIAKLDVYCVHRPAKATPSGKRKASEMDACCDWKGKLSALECHRKECPGVELACNNRGCGAKHARRLMQDHTANCRHRLQKCAHCQKDISVASMPKHVKTDCLRVLVACSCKAMVPRGDLQRHIDDVCPEKPLPCIYRDLGCAARVARKDLDGHMQAAALRRNELLMLEIVRLKADAASLKSDVSGLKADVKTGLSSAKTRHDKLEESTSGRLDELENTADTSSAMIEAFEDKITTTLSWKVKGMADKICKSGQKTYYSSYFYLPMPFVGKQVFNCGLTIEKKGKKVEAGFFFYNNSSKKSSTGHAISLNSWSATLSGTKSLGGATKVMSSNAIIERGQSLGWPHFVEGITPYIVDDAVKFEISAKVPSLSSDGYALKSL